MTINDIIHMVEEAGLGDLLADEVIHDDELARFAGLVAAAERRKHQADIERWKGSAATAEKWRGMALARHGDGRTVQAVQDEAREAEREACAKLCDLHSRLMWNDDRKAQARTMASVIRARKDVK